MVREFNKGLINPSVENKVLFLNVKIKQDDKRTLQFSQIKKDLGSKGKNSDAIKTNIISV